MDERELLKERFKAAVSSAVKVISEQLDLEIQFGNNINPKKDLLNLPEVINLRNLQDFTNLRAFADSEALKIKYTDKEIYLENEPKGTVAKSLYAIAEKIRYEKIGSNKLKGVKNNIIQCFENKFKDKKINEIKTEADVPIAEAFELYLRSYFFNMKQNNVKKKFLSKFGIYNKKSIPSSLFVSGNFDLQNIRSSFYEISDNEKLGNEDVNFIEEEFNDLMLTDGYENLFRFPKFVEFVKSITSEIN